MKRILGTFFILSSICLRSTAQVDSANDSSFKNVTLDSFFLKHIHDSPLDYFINICADSIDHMTNDNIPVFLTNTQFDYDLSALGRAIDNPSPLRKMIFDRVKNCKALKIILEDPSGIYRKKPVIEHDIHVDFLSLSYYDLAKKRYSRLKCSAR